ncbi:hypothetical protein GQ600_20926 [Phytophthora cactorum]|nr:hypothetical protein GQ600_20926 [Phytophthora cactorum]
MKKKKKRARALQDDEEFVPILEASSPMSVDSVDCALRRSTYFDPQPATTSKSGASILMYVCRLADDGELVRSTPPAKASNSSSITSLGCKLPVIVRSE